MGFNTMLGHLGYADSDADKFFAAAAITDAVQKSAVTRLTIALKAAGIWSKMHGLYPFVGGTASKHSYNLKNPSQYQITWSGSVTHNAYGIICVAGTSGDTGILGNTSAFVNNLAFGIYNRTAGGYDEAALLAHNPSPVNQLALYPRYLYDNLVYFDNAYAAGRVPVANSDALKYELGLILSSRTSASLHKGYSRGIEIVSATGAQDTLPPINISIRPARNLALVFVSLGLTAIDVSALTTAVDAFQTELGRVYWQDSVPLVTPTSIGTPRNDYEGEVGFRFVVGSRPVTISHLGRWIISGNNSAHTVRLYQSDGAGTVGAELASVTFARGPLTTHANNFPNSYLYGAVSTPVILVPGSYYFIVSTELYGADYWAQDAGTAFSVSEGLTGIYSCYRGGGVGAMGFGSPNTSYVPPGLMYFRG